MTTPDTPDNPVAAFMATENALHDLGCAYPAEECVCPDTPACGLLPAESIALTVALAQVQRGEPAAENVAAMCVLALARLSGRYDWTTEARR